MKTVNVICTDSTNNDADGIRNIATPNSLLILVGFSLLLILVVMVILMHRVSSNDLFKLNIKYFIINISTDFQFPEQFFTKILSSQVDISQIDGLEKMNKSTGGFPSEGIATRFIHNFQLCLSLTSVCKQDKTV